jgi:hypothetical protein
MMTNADFALWTNRLQRAICAVMDGMGQEMSRIMEIRKQENNPGNVNEHRTVENGSATVLRKVIDMD